MKAIRIHAYGDVDTLCYEEAPMPEPGPADIRIRVHAAAVNPVDWKIRAGYLAALIPYKMPLTLGWDVSGVVDKIGSEVTHLAVGDAVYCRPDIARDGSYAEYMVVRASEVAPKPETLSHNEAAAVPLAGLTAWQALFQHAQLKKGERVLIHAGAGGVGSFAIQFAKSAGTHVIATASSGNAALVRDLGADEFVDYRAQRFEEVLARCGEGAVESDHRAPSRGPPVRCHAVDAHVGVRVRVRVRVPVPVGVSVRVAVPICIRVGVAFGTGLGHDTGLVVGLQSTASQGQECRSSES